jgi:hypothetical protein
MSPRVVVGSRTVLAAEVAQVARFGAKVSHIGRNRARTVAHLAHDRINEAWTASIANVVVVARAP